MKRFITLSTLFLFVMAIHAQNQITIETTAGELKNVLTEEQKQTVTYLTLTGSMDDSDFYTIRDEMPELKILDMRKVVVDSIPVKAFYESSFDKCTLPESLVYIGDSAFLGSIERTYITKRFPKLGKAVFNDLVIPTEDNEYCRLDDTESYIIYSMDGKIVYLSKGLYSFIEEGTEVIESHAFDQIHMYKVYFPSTLKLIKEHAFSNIEPNFPIGGYGRRGKFIFNAEIPPTLEKNAFATDKLSFFTLVVPDGKEDLYKQADPQWSKFRNIVEVSEITNQKKSSCPIILTQDAEGITIKSDKKISKFQVCTLSGACCYSQNEVGTDTYIPKFNHKGVYIFKAVFEDDSLCYLKIIF